MINKLKEWSGKNLSLFWLPTYSPKENLIEILWRFLKYEWIEINAYENWQNLLKYIEKVLSNLGTEYVIILPKYLLLTFRTSSEFQT